jgi:molybdopterin converting factor subunit 1
MKITIRLFAVLRERAGVSQLTLELPVGATVATAKDSVLQEYPQLANVISPAAFAVNRSYSSASAELRDGDELAFLPPVSGG